jgi:hypothetical protein
MEQLRIAEQAGWVRSDAFRNFEANLEPLIGLVEPRIKRLEKVIRAAQEIVNDRISAAYTAALVFQAAPRAPDREDALGIPDALAKQILDSIGARAVAMKMGQRRRLLASDDMPLSIDQDIDMRDMPWQRAIIDALRVGMREQLGD